MEEDKNNRERMPLVDESIMNNKGSAKSQKNSVVYCQHCKKQKDFDNLYTFINCPEPGILESVKKMKSKCSFQRTLCSVFPILQWLPRYKWHTDIFQDITAGFTVAVLHIPQGLAYSTLAGVPSIVGIYMAFFPVLIYALMGTSRHISMGTFAVICMMAGNSVSLYATPHDLAHNKTVNVPNNAEAVTIYTPIQVVSALSLVVGLWQLLLGIFRLGSLYIILSEHLISGLITGAAISVIVSQLKHVLGLKIFPYSGVLKVVYTLMDAVKQSSMINCTTVIITVTIVVVLTFYNRVLKAYLKKRIPIALPTELIVIISATLISKFFNLPQMYNVTTVGEIPLGFPTPMIPPLELCPKLVIQGFVICVVSFSVNISMASLFSEKHKYRIKPNQELIASGCANMFASMFSCAPFSASLSRSLVQEMSGGRTQLASVISCIFLSFILLFVGPFFEPLPNCILAAIILVAMQNILLGVRILPTIWRQSKYDFCIWLATFFSVLLIDIDVGLAVGIIVSLIYIVLLGQKVKVDELGNIPNTDLYVYMKNYQVATALPGVIILRIVGGMNYANKDNVYKLIFKKINKSREMKLLHIILDFTSVSYVDPPSVKSLLKIHDNLNNKNMVLSISNCSPSILNTFLRCDFFNSFPELQLFPSVHDAVLNIKYLHK